MLKVMLWLKSKSESNECNRVQNEEQQNPMEHTIETARALSRTEAGRIETLLTGLAWLDRAFARKEQPQNSQRVLGSAGWYELSTGTTRQQISMRVSSLPYDYVPMPSDRAAPGGARGEEV